MKTGTELAIAMLIILVLAHFHNPHQSRNYAVRSQDAPTKTADYQPLPGETKFYETYRKLPKNETFRVDHPIRLGWVENLHVVWNADVQTGTYSFRKTSWIVQDDTVSTAISRHTAADLYKAQEAVARAIVNGEHSFKVKPVVVPLDLATSSGSGWGGTTISFGTHWYWQPATWPPVNLTSLDAISRCEEGNNRVARGNFYACSDMVVDVTCDIVGDRKNGANAVGQLRIWRAAGTLGISHSNATDRAVALYAGMKFLCGAALFEVVEVSATKLVMKCRVMSASLNWAE
jgi:hypothetical protein